MHNSHAPDSPNPKVNMHMTADNTVTAQLKVYLRIIAVHGAVRLCKAVMRYRRLRNHG